MPSSVGHALAGLAVSRLLGGRSHRNWPHVLLSTAADLDIAAAVLRRKQVDYSYRRSHSIGAAIAAGAAIGGAAWLLGSRFVPHAAIGVSAYASHLLLDYYGKGAGSGLPLLWPVSERRFATDRPVFRTINTSRDHFISGLLTKQNLQRVGREIAIIAPAVIASGLLRRRDRSSP